MPAALSSGAEGVGLYRTEFGFMIRPSFPSEQEQYRSYRKILLLFAPKPVTMRTLDIGGDKNTALLLRPGGRPGARLAGHPHHAGSS